jgi:hypothetical protein
MLRVLEKKSPCQSVIDSYYCIATIPPMPRTRGQERRSSHVGINTPLLLVCLLHIARHEGVAIPELLEVTAAAGFPVSRSTLNRLLSDAEAHLGVRVRFRRDGHMPAGGEYWIEDWGVLDERKVLRRLSRE